MRGVKYWEAAQRVAASNMVGLAGATLHVVAVTIAHAGRGMSMRTGHAANAAAFKINNVYINIYAAAFIKKHTTPRCVGQMTTSSMRA